MSAVMEVEPGKALEVVADAQHPAVAQANKLIEAGKFEQAAGLLEQHLLYFPNDAQALTILSTVVKKANKFPIAYHLATRATQLRPDRSETWSSLGHAAQRLWLMDEAEVAYRKAIARAQSDKQKALYFNNLASMHLDMGRFEKAENVLRQSLAIAPDDRMARHNMGLALLAQRKWVEGWQNYSASIGTESRRDVRYRNPPEPTWDGTKDKTVVVYGEQGLGDEICAASMLPDAILDSRKVIVDCDHRLAGLFRRSFPQASVYGTRWAKPGDGSKWAEKTTDIDASISAFELGKFYRKRTEDFPGTAYLIADPDRVTMWKSLWASKRKPTIGIAWSGGIWVNAEKYRQLPLREWQPIFDAVDAHWVSLQYKDASADTAGTEVVQYEYATLTKDYDDTAALVASCDLVIGMQTSVMHLCGALGVEGWTLIPHTSQWRYGEDYTDIPWYRSLKIYRQKDLWAPVVQKIAADLKERFK